MDDREEHGGRSAHSSVGGIYRSNRTVSTCLCHLPECACGDSPRRLRRRLVATGYARKCFVCERSFFSPCVGIVCISSALPLMMYDIYFLPCSLHSQMLVIPLRLRCVSRRLFKVSALIPVAVGNIFIIILYNIIDRG